MKSSSLTFSTFLLLTSLIAFSSCDDECTQTQQFYVWEPVFKNLELIRSEFSIEDPRSLENPGKIYFYSNYIFVSELEKGVHIIDNADPANPTPIKFISVPGNKDMAVKNGRLYLDNYIDLLTIDITDPIHPTLTNRTENVFKDYSLIEDFGYLVDYVSTLETVEIDCNDPMIDLGWGWCTNCSGIPEIFTADASLSNSNAPSAAATAPANTGIGGSFARFTVAQNHLYTVDEYDLNIFSLTDCDNPDFLGNKNIGWGIETIFPYEDKLFIGSNAGMFIYDISVPEDPAQLSEFQHARACDPVYVTGDVAYVTLRDGNRCAGYVNQLDIIDISDLLRPTLIKSHEMTHPHGLSIKGDALYLCEGAYGIKVFDRSSHQLLLSNMISSFEDLHAYDIITLPNNLALVIGEDGLYQYDISDPNNMVEVSKINVIR